MFNINIRQAATAAIAALIVSTACVGAAVAPVQAATPQTVQSGR
jgi:hypothetical protein